MDAGEAQEYHSTQINIFSRAPVDIVSAITMNYVEEALGIAAAAEMANLPD